MVNSSTTVIPDLHVVETTVSAFNSSDRPLLAVIRASQHEMLAKTLHSRALDNRREAIRDAIAAGASVENVAKVLGLSARRVQVIAGGG